LAEERFISACLVHHQGGIDQEKLNGDMKSRHRDLLNTKRSFFVEKLQHAFTFGNGDAADERLAGREWAKRLCSTWS
jgi:hypothetical protein